jgi:hypothetical protein
MQGRPYLALIAGLLEKHRLEAILIGNAAAALQGSPVTTVDIDFLFRKTPGNVRKLKAIAAELGAVLLRPVYPVSGLYRVMRDEDTLQVDFMSAIHGITSFESLRSRSVKFPVDGHSLLVANISDIIRSKRAAGRPQDLGSIFWKRAVPKKKQPTRAQQLEALKKETERDLIEQIRRQLARPPEDRLILRKRVGIASTAV